MQIILHFFFVFFATYRTFDVLPRDLRVQKYYKKSTGAKV